jgi:hypothetical protein
LEEGSGEKPKSKWDGSIPAAYRRQLVDLWNSAKPPNARPGSEGDLRAVNDAIWGVDREGPPEGRADPLGFLLGQMRAYLASREAKTYPTSLRNFITKAKYLETPEQWNHAGTENGTALKFDAHRAVAEALAENPLPERKARR